MSILTYPLGFIGGGKEFYNGVIENSLMFEDAGDSYFFKTDHGTSTSTGIVTFSCWVKRGILTDDTTIIFGTKSSTAGYLRFNADDGIYCNFFDTGYNGEGRGPKWTINDRPTRGHVMRHPVAL